MSIHNGSEYHDKFLQHRSSFPSLLFTSLPFLPFLVFLVFLNILISIDRAIAPGSQSTVLPFNLSHIPLPCLCHAGYTMSAPTNQAVQVTQPVNANNPLQQVNFQQQAAFHRLVTFCDHLWRLYQAQIDNGIKNSVTVSAAHYNTIDDQGIQIISSRYRFVSLSS